MSGFDLGSIETSPELEQDGVWRSLADGCEVLVARPGNPKHKKYVQAQARKHKREIQAEDDLSTDRIEKINMEAMAKFVFLGIRGALKEDGTYENVKMNGAEITAFNPEVAAKLLSNRGIKEKIEEMSNETAFYLKSYEQELLGK